MSTHPLVQKLSRRDDLNGDEISLLKSMLSPPRRCAPREEIVRQGEAPGFSTLLLSGLCGRVTTLANGGRQITQISVAGDFLDLHSFTLKVMDHSVTALCEAEIATVRHDQLRRLTESHPHLARVLWLETTIDAAIHRQWIVSQGRRSGLARMAHLFCETHQRLKAADRVIEDDFAFPITQADLGDILGISTVHANRLLQSLRTAGLIRWTGGIMSILAWERLCELAEFDPLYLRLHKSAV